MTLDDDRVSDDATIRALEGLVTHTPDDQGLRLHLTTLLLAAKRFADAIVHCRVLLDSDPGHVDALELAARAWRGTGDVKRADRYLAAIDRLTRELVPTTATAAASAAAGATVDVTASAVRLTDVAGMQQVKRRLHLAFLGPLANPELRALYGKSLRGGLLLWGPPGCGKTYLARAIAGELGAKFISVGLEDVLDMWTGRSERNLHEIFETARRQAPCVLFFDELDALGQKRGNLRGAGGRNVVVQLLDELDGVNRDNEGVFVLGATNHPWDVDTALRRPGRLGRMLLVLPPDVAARAAIFAMTLRDRPTENLDLDALARETSRFSGADLVQVCETATELALESSMASGTVRPIRQDDLRAAIAEVKESTSAWLAMARNFAEFANEGGAYDDLLDYLRVRELRS